LLALLLQHSPDAKYAVWVCGKNNHNEGSDVYMELGDQLGGDGYIWRTTGQGVDSLGAAGMMWMLRLAATARRVLLLKTDDPCPMEDLLEPGLLDWRVGDMRLPPKARSCDHSASNSFFLFPRAPPPTTAAADRGE
jgi:hypothetical protein